MPSLPEAFALWEEVASDLPKLLAAGRARRTMASLPVVSARGLVERPDLERAMGTLSVLGNATVHESWRSQSAASVPAPVAIPWVEVARRVGRPPILSYASHVLHNWRRLDPGGPVALGNLAVLRNFYGGLDEDWFLLVHVEVEARAAPVMQAAFAAQESVRGDDVVAGQQALEVIGDGLDAICKTMERVGEGCDPDTFFIRVQPFLHGFHEVVFEGVEGLGPQTLAGGSGAQSTIVPVLDALLGVEHAPDPLIQYLIELRRYMPPEDRALLADVEAGPRIRDLVLAHRAERPLVAAYDRALEGLRRFRDQHLDLTVEYIQRPALRRREARGERGERGTGGSPFVAYLKKHREETSAQVIGA